MKKNLLIIVFLFSAISSFAQDSIRQSAADSAWEVLSKIMTDINYETDIVKSLELYEKAKIKYWEDGRLLWKKFPTDGRRYEWLKKIIRDPPRFWNNIREANKDSYVKS